MADLDLLERELGDHLSRTLRAAAASAPTWVRLGEPADPAAAARQRKRRWRRLGGILAVGGLAVGGTAAWLTRGPGQIERIEVEHALVHGSGPSGDWYLLPVGVGTPDWGTEHCRYPGVAMIAEVINRPGQEWNGGGVDYGEAVDSADDSDCPVEYDAWLADPTRFNLGYGRLGYERPSTPIGGYAAVHPTIRSIRVEADDQPARVVRTVARPDAPDGPRYAGFAVPGRTQRITVTLLDADGHAVGTPRTTGPFPG
jgi:hypothetical protein